MTGERATPTLSLFFFVRDMIVIKDLEYYEVPDNIHEVIYQIGGNTFIDVNTQTGPIHMPTIEVRKEVIEGKVFVDQQGNRVVVGLSKDAQNILGLQYEAWENSEKEINTLRKDISQYRRSVNNLTQENLELNERIKPLTFENKYHKELIRELTDASLWTRIKWIFKGIPQYKTLSK